MFKLLAFFVLLACAMCAPAPEPAPAPAPAPKPSTILTYSSPAVPLTYEYRYPLTYANGYAYNSLGYQYILPRYYPLAL